MTQKSQKIGTIRLFVSTLASALLFVMGGGTLLLMFAPAAAQLLSPFTPMPQLPLAEAREEGFLDLNNSTTKQLYPPLPDAAPVEAGNWIRIPAINVAVPLVLSASLEDQDVLKTLDQGAALYPNGITPGHLGNTFVSAHSTGEPWKGKYRFAFLHINKLQSDNLLHLDYNGARYTYRIVDKEIVTPTADFRVVSDRPAPTVTLMACWPLWSTSKRMLIHGELTNITQLTQPAI
jgi:LPXTG-site transpeptidase (sortase) family protein